MSGNQKLSGYALVANYVPFVLYDEIASGSPTFGTAVWMVNDIPGQNLTRTSDRGDSINSVDYMDPEPSPDSSKVVFASTPIGAGSAGVMQCDVASPPNSVTSIDTNPSALVLSMQPSWHPNGTKVVYRTIDNAPNECEVRSCDVAPASTPTTLKTVARTNGDLYFPRYSPSGDYIAYLQDTATTSDLTVMNADGTGATVVANIGTTVPQVGWEYCWLNNSDVLVYQVVSAGSTTYRTVNADGTGDTLIWTDPNTSWWGLTKRSATADDSSIMVFSRSLGSDPRFELFNVQVDGGGGAAVSPSRTSYAGTNDFLAFVYGNRVYWANGDNTETTDVVSCLPDGSDFRVEFSMSSPPTGYVSIEWIGGFEGRLNSPS